MHPPPGDPPAPALPWLPTPSAATVPRPSDGNQPWGGSSRCKVYWRGRGAVQGGPGRAPRGGGGGIVWGIRAGGGAVGGFAQRGASSAGR